jgi:type IV fimbrial biogenesis protein FimT
MKPLSRGFSIIEMMVVITITGILMMIVVPSFQTYLQNLQIRSAAEALVAGLQIAKNEAIRRNVNVQLGMGTGTTWTITLVSDGSLLQQRDSREGSPNVTSTLFPDGATAVTFNGMGRIVLPNNADGSAALTQIDLDNPVIPVATDRRLLRIVIPPGGAVRMCDKQVVAPDPRACP